MSLLSIWNRKTFLCRMCLVEEAKITRQKDELFKINISKSSYLNATFKNSNIDREVRTHFYLTEQTQYVWMNRINPSFVKILLNILKFTSTTCLLEQFSLI